MGLIKRGLRFFGVREDDRLVTALPHMNQQQLNQQYKMYSLRTGSAATGLALNSSMILYPAFVVGAALNLRQLVIARRTKKRIKEALRTANQQASGAEAPPVGHVKGTVRYFLLGAGMKGLIFVAFLGHVHAEDFVLYHLNPMNILEHLPHGDVVASFLPMQEITHALHENVHEVFAVPHAFNDNPIVAALQELGNAPREAMLGVDQDLQTWGQVEGLANLTQQIAVGPAIEANVPAMMGERAMENAAEEWSGRHRSTRRR